MNVLIAYASRLGSTKEIAERIAIRLQGHGIHTITSTVELAPDVVAFDGVVIGSAVYAGHWLGAARQFIETDKARLSSRPVWLFSSGPVGKLATSAAPIEVPELRGLMASIGAREHRTFAGALDRSTIDAGDFPFIERVVARRFVPEGDFRNWPAIDAWADEIASALRRGQPTESRPAIGAGLEA
jgi:menaquinone-dependent protoporphyrinogen oxidase